MTGHSVAKHTGSHVVKRAKNKSSDEQGKANLGFWSLLALVIGGIIGSGVFNLITSVVGKDASHPTSTVAILLGWGVAGLGFLLLVLCFYVLNKKRPDLDAGVYSYAQAGFGKYMGFNSAWGYWISAWIGNVAYGTVIFASLDYFLHNGMFVGADGSFTVWTVLGASVFLWLITFLVSRGLKSAGFMNVITTIAKLIPLFIFLVAAALAFKFNVFNADFWTGLKDGGQLDFGSLMSQVQGTMLALVFVFIGIEGASVFSGQAKSRKSAGAATVIGFLTVLAIYVLATVLSLGVMHSAQVAGINPNNGVAMAQILDKIMGGWGWIVSAGVIVSVIGAWLAWTLFPMEIPYEAAKNGAFPKLFAKTNKRGVPVASLLITSAMIQIFFLIYLVSAQPYNLMFALCSSMILVPYFLVAAFMLKENVVNKKNRTIGGFILGALATLYAGWLLYAGGVDYLLTMTILYLIGAPFYVIMRKQAHEKKVFTNIGEWLVFALILVVGLYAIWWMIWGGGWSTMIG